LRLGDAPLAASSCAGESVSGRPSACSDEGASICAARTALAFSFPSRMAPFSLDVGSGPSAAAGASGCWTGFSPFCAGDAPGWSSVEGEGEGMSSRLVNAQERWAAEEPATRGGWEARLAYGREEPSRPAPGAAQRKHGGGTDNVTHLQGSACGRELEAAHTDGSCKLRVLGLGLCLAEVGAADRSLRSRAGASRRAR
jgi:hypothetical protein